MRLISMLLLVVVSLCAQNETLPRGPQNLPGFFIVDRQTTGLSSGTEKITIQLPVSSTNTRVRLLTASVTCSAACTLVQEKNGTAATATALTPTKVNIESEMTLTVEAYRSSNVGTATWSTTYPVQANIPFVLDLEKVYLIGKTGATNYSLGIQSFTGDVRITITGQQY